MCGVLEDKSLNLKDNVLRHGCCDDFNMPYATGSTYWKGDFL